jgi:uncharacterized protein with HEPN domain
LNPAERDFLGYLDDILENARKLKSLIAGLSFEEFQADEKTQYAIMRAIEVIGEATKRFQTISVNATPKFPGAIWRGCATFSSINMKGWTRACCTPQRRVKSMS